jgi:phosphoribosylformylglycinamidine cyclo-ligase
MVCFPMPPKRSLTYEDAGVSFREAGRAKARIKTLAQQTFDKNVLTGIGSFGAAYALYGQSFRQPILISSADGVGTKLKVAFATGVHNTVGQDLVNHCVNDIAVQGARPLFFLDYLATGKLDAAVTAKVIEGLSRACKQNGCALIGGETAEMPGMYHPGEYDLAGFIVGVAERGRMLDGKKIRAGHSLIGLPSTGLHTNGYSLARKLLFEVAGYEPATVPPKLGVTLGSELLKIHRSYHKAIQSLLAEKLLDGAAHITGGGITDNTPRMLPAGLRARVRYGAWPVLPVFDLLREIGAMKLPDMLQTFNMGIGMILAVQARSEAKALATLRKNRERAYVIGQVEKGRGGVVYE